MFGKFWQEMVDTDLVGQAKADKNTFLQRISCNPMRRNPIKVAARSRKVELI